MQWGKESCFRQKNSRSHSDQWQSISLSVSNKVFDFFADRICLADASFPLLDCARYRQHQLQFPALVLPRTEVALTLLQTQGREPNLCVCLIPLVCGVQEKLDIATKEAYSFEALLKINSCFLHRHRRPLHLHSSLQL